MGELRKRALRLLGAVAALTLLVAPTSAVAQEQQKAPVTVPALTNWSAEQGGYVYGAGARLVADTPACLLYTSPSPRDRTRYRMPSSA